MNDWSAAYSVQGIRICSLLVVLAQEEKLRNCFACFFCFQTEHLSYVCSPPSKKFLSLPINKRVQSIEDFSN
jgi:hypothetical protein